MFIVVDIGTRTVLTSSSLEQFLKILEVLVATGAENVPTFRSEWLPLNIEWQFKQAGSSNSSIL